MQSSFGKRSKRYKRLHVNTFLCLALTQSLSGVPMLSYANRFV